MATISQAPATLDIVAVKGDDLTITLTITENGTAYDWTGATVATSILDSSGTAVATNFTSATPANGTLTLTLTDTQTNTLGVATYRWQVNVTKASATRTWLAGALSVMQPGWGGTSTSSASLSITTGAVTVTISNIATVAASVAVTDAANYFSSSNVENVLAELSLRDDYNVSPAASTTGDSNGKPTYPAIVAIGDSITENNYAATSWTGTSFSRTAAYRGDGYLARAMIIARQPCSWISSGVSGNTTTQMLARFDTDVTSLRPRVVIEAGGTNDVRTGVAASTIYANKIAMWNKAWAFGAKVIATTIPPASDSTTAQRNTAQQVNAWLREYARTNPKNFALVDWYQDLVDPLTGGVKTSVMDTLGIHPNGTGAYVVAQRFANAILQFVGYPTDPLPSDNVNDLDNMMNTPLMTGSSGTPSGGVTGVVATSWFASGSAVASKVSRADGLGEWQQLACTGTTSMIRNAAARWSVGDLVYASCEFETDSAGWSDGLVTAKLNCFAADGTTALHFATAWSNGADTTSGGRHPSGILRTPIIQIPTGTASIRLDLQKVNAGTVRFGRFEIRKHV